MDIAKLPTKGERTRALIVETAAGLFWHHNFHGVSVDQIADAANVNKATVYRYFADKRDLALAVVRYNSAFTLDMIFATTFGEFSKPEDRLAGIYRLAYFAHKAMYDDTGDVFGCPITSLALELGQDMPEIREEAQRAFDEVERFLTNIAEDAIAAGAVSGDPRTIGRTLTQMQHGAFAASRIAASPERMLEAGRAALAFIGYPDKSILEQEQSPS